MKKIFLLSASLLIASATFAQSGMSGTQARFGLKAGVNLSQMHYSGFNGAKALNDATENNVGYNITAYGDFGVGKNFFIQPGISLQNKGTKLNSGSAFGGTTTGTSTVNVMAIEIPVNAVVRIPAGTGAFQLSAGPYIGFNIDGKVKSETVVAGNTTKSETDLKFGNTTGDDISGTDFGANFGLGYRLSNGLTLNANYGLGLTNLYPKDKRSGDEKAVNRILGFSVGFSF